MVTREYQTTKIWKKTLKKLQLITEITDETAVRVLDRLVDKELERLKKITKEENKPLDKK